MGMFLHLQLPTDAADLYPAFGDFLICRPCQYFLGYPCVTCRILHNFLAVWGNQYLLIAPIPMDVYLYLRLLAHQNLLCLAARF